MAGKCVPALLGQCSGVLQPELLLTMHDSSKGDELADIVI